MTYKFYGALVPFREDDLQSIGFMKRYGNLYGRIVDMDNLRLAARKAMKGKFYQAGVREYLKDPEGNLTKLHRALVDKTYKISPYKIFVIFEPKRREIYRLPFIDRVVQHAIMNILEDIWVSMFTADTYSCIKGRGVHSAALKIKKALQDEENTTYCLKIDVRKFYPSVDRKILKQIIRLKIKDKDLLSLLDSIIDSAEGLPIGNYLSQHLANLYMTYFDHWLKETMKVRYYFRYCDDIAIFSGSKRYLHQILSDIRIYLEVDLHLSIKSNYQVFSVEIRGVDMLGYVFRRRYTRLRKSIKKNFARAVAKRKSRSTIEAYKGWTKHADCKNLLKVLSDEKNKEVQRNGHSGRGRWLDWRKNQHEKAGEPRNYSARV
ncbi:reverse transcriptase/maturase family protein [Dyadobacter sp. LHD-138]|uniref:reverse transcriptase/maturase family protein n=1 Tax=Dyadobacter sp. LHD-138 TaxID=3071413 RepID=UPI0027DFE96F|nr:reverse transcriptase/maturase family protein [Dyadobacter sp. LHD-138]MDQ6477828.1 reverse transcriptase/maturase family protein [Dyadobacter sp. LHD-138]